MQKVKDYSTDDELELYKAMLKAQPQSMFLLDDKKHIVGIFNAAPETLAGQTIDEIVGNSILKYANDPESPFYQACSMLNDTFDDVFNLDETKKFQYMVQDAYLEATITKITKDRVLSQVRDISDIVLKQRDIEKKKRNELSVALIAGGLTSWSYDVERDIISSTHNNNVIRNKMSLNDLLSLIVPEHRGVASKMFDDLIKHKCDHGHIKTRTKNSDGEIQWSEVHAVPHEYGADGSVKLIIGSQKDVTTEYEHNQKIGMLNRQNSLILNNTNSGFMYLTADMNVEWENVSVVFSDKEIVNLFYQGTNLTDEKNNALKSIKEAIGTKKLSINKFKTSKDIVLETVAQPVFNELGAFEGVVVRIDDITDSERSMIELAEAKEKAEQSDKLKTAFLANMSHEIRTPLNSIVGFSQILPDVETEEERQEYIEIINYNTQVLLNLINDILDLSKIEAGYFSHNNSFFDLSDLFLHLYNNYKDKVKNDDVIFIYDQQKSNGLLVFLDRVRVMQIMTNFITNALKFTKTGHVKIGFENMGNSVRFYVEDTGCGLKPEQIDHVFDRFEKFDSFEQGTGLGAAIAKAIAESYNGEIGVDSIYGEGCTFWAILPKNLNSPTTPPLP